MLKGLPARYAKFLTSLFGQLVLFSQLSGGFSHVTLTEALTAVGVSLGVLAVPNAGKSVQISQAELDSLRAHGLR